MQPVFWKVSMGPGGKGPHPRFKHILEVIDWVRQGLVIVNARTRRMAGSPMTQGEYFVKQAQVGDYFYLCHGNKAPSVILLGQFTGPANLLSAYGDGWADRPFRWIRTSINPRRFRGRQKWWAPNFHSTFVEVPYKEFGLFEEAILKPYFGMSLAEFRLGTDGQ
jgi:hypothetical protein